MDADTRRQLHNLKKAILNFEADFEAKNGRKPVKSEKRPIADQLRQYKKLKSTQLQLQQQSQQQSQQSIPGKR